MRVLLREREQLERDLHPGGARHLLGDDELPHQSYGRFPSRERVLVGHRLLRYRRVLSGVARCAPSACGTLAQAKGGLL